MNDKPQSETSDLLRAYQQIGNWLKETFNQQFGNRWHSGFVHCAISPDLLTGHRSFVTYQSGKGGWVNIELSEKLRANIRMLILEKKAEKDRINSLRIYLWMNRKCEFDYLTDPSIAGYYAAAPMELPSQTEKSVKDLIIEGCIGYLQSRKTKPFQYVHFEFCRIVSHLSSSVRMIDLFGNVSTEDFLIGNDLETLLICFWEQSNMKARHLLQIALDECFEVKVSFLDSHILRTLEDKIQKKGG